MKILVIGGTGLIGSKLVNGIIEIAGPTRYSLADLVQQYLVKIKDPRTVVTDLNALYYGARLADLTLVPGDNARIGTIEFDTWFDNLPKK